MTHFPCWPAPADKDAAARLLERFAERGPAEAALAGSETGRPMLEALGGGSPYLSDLLIREHGTALACWQEGPGHALRLVQADLEALDTAAPQATVAASLRAAKRRIALLCAIADIGGAWTLARVTETLSWLAETALRKAIDHLLLATAAAGKLALPNPAAPGQGSGLIVLGMGKLGAGELNYSSDIDLILFYDPSAQPDRDALAATFTRIARTLVTILEARDANGYVFRTDLRLRPDPAATPPVVALPAALAYYESMGQNWERAAMIKARPIAGDIALGLDFLRQIRPFVWRRLLDFAAIADLYAMKQRINHHKGLDGPQAIAGLDVKLGRGGIREVEFVAQTLLLVWGGRDPSLRDPTTVGALRQLFRAGKLGRRAAAELIVAYRALRAVEHRLQMVSDRQTHAIPTKPDEIERFSIFLGFPDASAFSVWLERHMDRVRQRYAEVFEAVPEPPPGTTLLDLSGTDDPPATVAALHALQFKNTPGVIATLRSWRTGRLRALRSARSRELIDLVLPTLLAALAEQTDPDAAFMRFDQMLQRLPAGVQILSMLQRNPALVRRVAAVLGAAPSLSEHLATVPMALEGLLAPEIVEPEPARLLHARLADARSLEDVIAITRSLVRAEEFRLCVGQMEGRLDVDAAGLARTALADAALAALLQAVLRNHGERYGRVPGGAVAVVALGKAGSREMMAGSDLDLMLIYGHAPGATESEAPSGARVLPVSTWFIRAAHAFVAALTAPGADGPLYAADMRLRPSGSKGPVAVSLAAFRRYHAENAWTWERMALTRARVVACDCPTGDMTGTVEAAIAAALAHAQPADMTRSDAAQMRGRLLREHPPTGPWDVKLRPGGIIDVEFIAQTLLLVTGVPPGLQRTADALAHLAAIGAIPPGDAASLIEADRLWRTVQSMLRILVGRTTTELPSTGTAPLLQATGALDLSALHATMDETAAVVSRAFQTLVGDLD
ncbi:MAG: bifunctional [glutamine synthetase] adenylyltransferase/[glutamine synthetase]-adenylyl-L-tyrosine phosphorylase [Acetobacteraceae bacterium]|nr:bifunctional [glutamine synthetase] adenylyltransferase/[glutamine synthetase]-adenylyl-L-tyrosine phosphorylase [Acetobacteraceae bacterium]